MVRSLLIKSNIIQFNDETTHFLTSEGVTLCKKNYNVRRLNKFLPFDEAKVLCEKCKYEYENIK